MNKKHMVIPLLILVIVMSLMGIKKIRLNRKPDKVVMVVKSIDDKFEFWHIVKIGAEMAAQEEEVVFEYSGPQRESDLEGQKEIVRKIIEEKPDILILAATNEEELIPLCEEAAQKGIKVFTIDSNINSDIPISFSATDSEAATQLLAEYVVDNLINQQGEVAIINLLAGVTTANEREKGITSVLNKHSAIKTHPTIYTDGTSENAHKVTLELLKENPNINTIFGCNQKTTEGVVKAVEELGLTNDVTVAGFDSSLEIIHAIEKGIVDVIVLQKPFNMGYISVKNAINNYKGIKVPKKVNTGYKLITKSTLNELENQKLLYPLTK